MPFLRETTLDQMLVKAQQIYASVDLRSLVVALEELINAATVLRFTCRSINDLNREHEMKLSLNREVGASILKVLFEAKPLDRIKSMIEEIKLGSITVANSKIRLQGKNLNAITNERLVIDSYSLGKGECESYETYAVLSSMDGNPKQFLRQVGVSALTHGFMDLNDLGSAYLGLQGLSFSADIYFVFPIYIRSKSIEYQGGNKVSARFEVLKGLLGNTKAWAIRRPSSEQMSKIPLEEQGFRVESVNENFACITLTCDFDNLDLSDKIEFVLHKKDLDFISTIQESMDKLFSSFEKK